jgi:OFA family oxalate/formate antiporter-like MFS transporter
MVPPTYSAPMPKSHPSCHARHPFDPERWPFFYGWWMLGMCVMTALCSAPGQTSGVSAFVPHLLEATGLSRMALANTYLAGTLLSACFIPFGGRLVDRFGARRVVVSAALMLAVTIALMSIFDRIASQMATHLHLPALATMVTLLALGFSMMRFTGQGLMSLSQQTTVGHWFDKRRGVAASISSVVLALVGNATPLFLNGLIDATGWRGAWRWLALLLSAGFALLALIFWRNTPESCGLWPDGRKPHAQATDHSPIAQSWTRAEALRTSAFWTVMPAIAMLGLIITALTFHLADIGATAGLSRKAAFAVLLPFGITTMVTGPFMGILADRIAPRWLLCYMVSMLAAHLVLMTQFGPGWRYIAPAIALGLATGTVGPLSAVTYPRFYGRLHLGAINGAQWAGAVVASAIGPSLYALVRHLTGSYRIAMLLLLLPLAILFVAGLRLTPPKRTGEVRG